MTQPEFDFKKDSQKANTIVNLPEKLLFWKERYKNYLQFAYDGGDTNNDINNYREEVKFLEDAISLKQMQIKNTPLHKEVEPLKWNNDVKQLAYLFWKLKKENIIENKNLGMTLSKLFIDKNVNEIKNTSFNKHFSDFDNINTFPDKAKDIDTFVTSIKEFHKKVE